MRAPKKIAVVVMVLLTGWAGGAWADVAAEVTSDAITVGTGAGESLGWRFSVDKKITITHLGLYDAGNEGLSSTHVMGIWRVKKQGGLHLELWQDIPSGGASENEYVYVPLANPFTIDPDPVPDIRGGVEYYEKWLVGVWSPTDSSDLLKVAPGAATLTIAQQPEPAIIRFEAYTFKGWVTYPDFSVVDILGSAAAAQNWVAWGGTTSAYHVGVNFKYIVGTPANQPPVAVDNSALTQINTPVAVDVLAGDSDPDGDSLSIADYTSGAYGSVMTVEGKLVYTPNRNFVGNDSFTYTISDGKGGTATATVSVTVNPGTILIDIKPGSSPNSINLGSNGVIPVAILSTAGLDATTLNPETIFLAGSSVAVRGKGNKYMSHSADVNGDGMADLVVQIETENLDPNRFQDGRAIVTVQNSEQVVLYQGDDEITIVPQ